MSFKKSEASKTNVTAVRARSEYYPLFIFEGGRGRLDTLFMAIEDNLGIISLIPKIEFKTQFEIDFWENDVKTVLALYMYYPWKRIIFEKSYFIQSWFICLKNRYCISNIFSLIYRRTKYDINHTGNWIAEEVEIISTIHLYS